MVGMLKHVENYALIGDCRSAALVGRTGSIDWLCMPRFDSASMFARILGDESHGHWSLHPLGGGECTSRQYEEDTFILVTRWVTETGEVEVIDSMPYGDGAADVARRVVGISGEVTMEQVLRIRFDYADAMPWIRQVGTDEAPEFVAIAGPDAVIVRGPQFFATDHAHRAEFTVHEGETVDTVLTWFPSHKTPYPPLDLDQQLADTRQWWRRWANACAEPGAYDAEVRRSLLVLRALTHETTGGIVAAPTTSLPEEMGGTRNWDYRTSGLRIAALTQLEALHALHAAYERGRLMKLAGTPCCVAISRADLEDVTIMYVDCRARATSRTGAS